MRHVAIGLSKARPTSPTRLVDGLSRFMTLEIGVMHRSTSANGTGIDPLAQRGVLRRLRRALDALLGTHSAQGLEHFEERKLLTVDVTNPVNDFLVFQNSQPTTIRIDDRFDDPDIDGQVIRFQSVLGNIFLELFQDTTPITTTNFLRYADNNLYDDTIIHRSIPGFVVQGGGFRFPGLTAIDTFNEIQNEFRLSNTRGTIAMAKLGGNPNSATSQWFFNLGDNSSNLDNQNGGFTVFGRVLGDGMTVVDAIAAVPVENLGSPFDDIPLRNFQGGEPTADNVILFETITRDSELTFTASSSNGALVAPQVVVVDGQARLQLTYGAGLGQATVTIRAQSRDGSFVEDAFTIRVVDQQLASPTLGEVRVTPDFIASPGPGATITLTALNVVDNDGTVTLVEYYRDNGDGLFDASTDTLLGTSNTPANNNRLTAPTAAGPTSVRYFARARDNDFLFSTPKTTTNTQNAPPTVGTFTVSSTNVTRPSSITLEVRNVVDASGIDRVEFWRDINGNGSFESDVDSRLGAASNIAGRYRFTLDTNTLPAGTIPFLAIAFDPQGLSGLSTASVVVTNLVPLFNGVSGETQVAVRGLTAELRVILPRDPDGELQGAEYWLDVNGNSIIDTSVDTLVARGDDASNNFLGRFNTSQFNLGVSRIMVRVVDDDNAPSAVQVINFRVNRAPQIQSAVLASPTVETNATVTVRALNVSDPDGILNGVEIFWDRDNNGVLNTQLFDTLLGRAIRVGSNWTYTFNASILYDNFNNRIFAQAIDSEGARSPATTLQVQIVRRGAASPAQNPYDPEEFRMPNGQLITELPLPRGASGSVRRVWTNTLPAQAALSEITPPNTPTNAIDAAASSAGSLSSARTQPIRPAADASPIIATTLAPFHAESNRPATLVGGNLGLPLSIQIFPWAFARSLIAPPR